MKKETKNYENTSRKIRKKPWKEEDSLQLELRDLEEEAMDLPDRNGELAEKNRKRKNREYIIIIYLFVAVFLFMLGYFAYFIAGPSKDVINNAYNTRQDTFADRVIRGAIISEDGEVLASSSVDAGGKVTREYPYGNLFSHVVGYESKGKTGVESLANFQLLTSNAFIGEKIVKELKEQKNIGDNVITSLNVRLQKTASEALGNRKGAVIVLEPGTGRILAMVSKPDFDPGKVSENWESLTQSTDSVLLNRATRGQYTPGSVFKIVTTLDFLREGYDISDFYFVCEGSYTQEDYTINCYHGNVHGEEDFPKAFAKSCNSAFAYLGTTLDPVKFRSTCDDLLFDKDLPISLGSASSTFALTAADETNMKMMTAMGQGKTVMSPIHVAMITSAIANNGVLMKPYLITEVQNYEGRTVKKYKSSVYGNLMTDKEASTLQGLMENTVLDGTASKLSGKSYKAAGKTGTAEYSSNKDLSHAWFTGYCEGDKETIAITVIVEGGGAGSEAAVPIAAKVFDAYYE